MYYMHHEPAPGWETTLVAFEQKVGSIYSKSSQSVDLQASGENHGPPLIDPNFASLLVHTLLLEALDCLVSVFRPESGKEDGSSCALEVVTRTLGQVRRVGCESSLKL